MISKDSLTKYSQEGSDCAVCASATLANYFDRNIDFKIASKEASKISKNYIKEGLITSQICYLLNNLNIKKVTLVSADLIHLDFSWSKLDKKSLIKKIKETICNGKLTSSYKEECYWLLKFLRRKNFNNNLKISKDFIDIIKKSLDKGNPVLGLINWTLFFENCKTDNSLNPKPINGNVENHAVVFYKYNSEGVYAIDSKSYENEDLKIRKKAGDGYYFITWNELMLTIANKEVIIIN